MIHRRLVYDDSLGVDEPLNETAYGQGLVLQGKHVLVIEPPESSALYHRAVAQSLFMNPLNTYALPKLPYTNYSNSYHQTWSALAELLPYNLHLLTIDQQALKIFLIRVEHYFELNEDETYSKPAQIDLQILFNRLGKIVDLTELTLGGNLPLDEMKRLVWKTNNNESSYWKSTGMKIKFILNYNTFLFDILDSNLLKSTIVTLNPMEIKTFQVILQ